MRVDLAGHVYNLLGQRGTPTGRSFAPILVHSRAFPGLDHVDPLLCVGNSNAGNCTHSILRYLAFLVYLAMLWVPSCLHLYLRQVGCPLLNVECSCHAWTGRSHKDGGRCINLIKIAVSIRDLNKSQHERWIHLRKPCLIYNIFRWRQDFTWFAIPHMLSRMHA